MMHYLKEMRYTTFVLGLGFVLSLGPNFFANAFSTEFFNSRGLAHRSSGRALTPLMTVLKLPQSSTGDELM